MDSRIVGHTARAWLTCRRQRRGQLERSFPPDACWEVLPCIGNEGIVTPEGGVGLWSEGGRLVTSPATCCVLRFGDRRAAADWTISELSKGKLTQLSISFSGN